MANKFGEVDGTHFEITTRVFECRDGKYRTQDEVNKAGISGILRFKQGMRISKVKAKDLGLIRETKSRKGSSNKSRKGSSNKGSEG